MASSFNESCSLHSKKNSAPWESLRVVHHGARLRAGGTIPDVLAWPARASAGGPYSAGAGLHRQGGVRHHDHPRSLNAWPSTPRCVACVAGAGPGRSLARQPSPCSTFADSALPSRLHEALIDKTLRDHLVGHVSRDSTAIEGREKAAPKSKQSATPKRRRGRPRKGKRPAPGAPVAELSEMLDDLPRASDVGVKQGAKGHRESWSGYKLHIDAAWRHSAQLHPDLGVAA